VTYGTTGLRRTIDTNGSPRVYAMTESGRRPLRRFRVDVVGTGTASATPDVVRVSLGLRCEADGVSSALAQAADAVRAVSSAARAHGLEDADIASTSASVQPRWDRNGARVTGYTAYHQLTLRVRRLGDLNELIDSVAAAAGNALVIDGIALDLAERAPLEQAARAAAFANALAKARQYADLAGTSLGRVLAVVEQPGFPPGRPGPVPMAMTARAAADSSGMPVEAGEHAVTVTVQVSWALDEPT
jgi:uncharacterized protein YggE